VSNKLTDRSSSTGYGGGGGRRGSYKTGSSISRVSGEPSYRPTYGPRAFSELSREERRAHHRASIDRVLATRKEQIAGAWDAGQQAYKTYKSYVKPAIALLNRP